MDLQSYLNGFRGALELAKTGILEKGKSVAVPNRPKRGISCSLLRSPLTMGCIAGA
jgi:hypothetical protein